MVGKSTIVGMEATSSHKRNQGGPSTIRHVIQFAKVQFKGGSLMAVWVKKRQVIIGPVALVAIGFLFWCLWPSGETPADVLRLLGYLEMIPPSHFNGPGTISTIEIIDNNKFTLHPTC